MVKYLVYRKKKYPVRISYRALKGVREDLQSKLPEGSSAISAMALMSDFDAYETVLWWGLVSGAAFDKVTLDLKREDMEDMLDEVLMDFIKILPEFFAVEKEKGETSPGEALPPKRKK